MLPTNETLVAARNVVDEQIDKRIEELKREKYWDWQGGDDSDDAANLPFTCNFQLFGQLHPVPSHIKMSELLEYERGLLHRKECIHTMLMYRNRASVPSRYFYNCSSTSFVVDRDVFLQL